MSDLKVIVIGAAGNIGGKLVRLIREKDGISLAGAIESKRCRDILEKDIGQILGIGSVGVIVRTPVWLYSMQADVIIDFSHAQGFRELIGRVMRIGVPLVVGTTGLSATSEKSLIRAARSVPIVYDDILGYGMRAFIETADFLLKTVKPADSLGEPYYSIVINKAPIGRTNRPSRCIGKVLQANKDYEFDDYKDIYTALEGEYIFRLVGPGEEIELAYRKTDTFNIARGALAAARWVADREPGLYSMRDVLGIPREEK